VTARRGCFVTLEGIDGAGKSTHLGWLGERITAGGRDVVATREPGGTALGEALRELLLHHPMTHDTETLLMFAARREHLERVIVPALARGAWVLCDRFTDATFAYQGGGHGVEAGHIEALAAWLQGATRPDRTVLFDVPPGVSRDRLARSRAKGREGDRFEREDEAFFGRVRAAYLARAAAEPRRFRVVDASRPVPVVRAALDALVRELEEEFA
jgi:dTMP kinase